MSIYVTEAFRQEYGDAVKQKLQQQDSRFQGACMVETFRGSKAARPILQLGAVAAQQVTTRHGDTPLISTPHDARWVYPTDYVWADLIDHEDQIKMGAMLTSPYAINGASAMKRAKDDVVIAAFYADAKTGETGSTTTSFGANQDIAETFGSSGAAVGLNVAKLREAKRLLLAAQCDLDNDPAYIAVTAKAHDNLLAEVQVTSRDFTDRPALNEGKITRFMGFNFIFTERLPTDGTYRRIPVWVKSGMCLAIWNDVETNIGPRADKNYAQQVHVRGTFGATRTEEAKVVEIKCAE